MIITQVICEILRIESVEAKTASSQDAVIVRIKTDSGLEGIGEADSSPEVVQAIIDAPFSHNIASGLREILLGENPLDTGRLWEKMYRQTMYFGRSSVTISAMAAIDMALWDIAGKLYGVPVYRLLGGPVRDKIWMYPSPKAIKVGPGGGQAFAGTPSDVEGLVERVRQARAKVGPDGAVMFDAHSCLPPPLVKQFASYLKSDDLLFLEEAWVPGNIDVMRKVRASVSVPLATGERDRTIWEVREILEAQVIDILQPDCGHGGGISQMKKVAALAEAHLVPLAPHCTMSSLGLTASLHVAASVPFFLIHEGYQNVLPDDVARKTWTMDEDGYVSLPEGPGLGVEIDETRAREVGREENRQFSWPENRLPDGSVADY